MIKKRFRLSLFMVGNTIDHDLEERKKILVLWDVGAVLHTITYSRFFERAVKLYNQFHPDSAITSERFREIFVESGCEKRLDLGEISPMAFLDELSGIVSDGRMGREETLRLRKNAYGIPVGETIKLKRTIHDAGYSVGILSNMSQEAKRIFIDDSDMVFETYDPNSPRILSSEVHLMKPDPGIYGLVKGYDRVIFIEDKWEYLKVGIENFGWYGIWFTKYIDKAEGHRALHTRDESEMPTVRFERADTIDQLVKALSEFGVKI